MTYILLVYIYAGIFAKGDSVAMHSISGFNSAEECQAAGNALDPLVNNSTKEIRFVCLKARNS